MTDAFIGIALFLVCVSLLLALHEYAHLIAARWVGIRVERFSLGLGKPVRCITSQRTGIQYALGCIPFGGYVKMAQGRETPGSFNHAHPWRRIVVLLAGPLTNLALGIALYWLVFMLGVAFVKPVIGMPDPGTTAARTGIKSGSIVKRVEGQTVSNWHQVQQVLAQQEPPVTLTLQTPKGTRRTMHINSNPGKAGFELIAPEDTRQSLRVEQHPSPARAWAYTLNRTGHAIHLLWLIINGQRARHLDASIVQSAITQTARRTLKNHLTFQALIGFIALVSLSLAVFNLIPLPILDGGQTLIAALEWLLGRPLPDVVIRAAHGGSLAALAIIVFSALYDSISRLFY